MCVVIQISKIYSGVAPKLYFFLFYILIFRRKVDDYICKNGREIAYRWAKQTDPNFLRKIKIGRCIN